MIPNRSFRKFNIRKLNKYDSVITRRQRVECSFSRIPPRGFRSIFDIFQSWRFRIWGGRGLSFPSARAEEILAGRGEIPLDASFVTGF